jgi:hypothetical protein
MRDVITVTLSTIYVKRSGLYCLNVFLVYNVVNVLYQFSTCSYAVNANWRSLTLMRLWRLLKSTVREHGHADILPEGGRWGGGGRPYALSVKGLSWIGLSWGGQKM